jgi:hypothetical protein
MNISNSEAPCEIVAKTCGCEERHRKVTYSFVDTYHNLCKDKKDIIVAEIQACETLRNYTKDELDMKTIETEIADIGFVTVM